MNDFRKSPLKKGINVQKNEYFKLNSKTNLLQLYLEKNKPNYQNYISVYVYFYLLLELCIFCIVQFKFNIHYLNDTYFFQNDKE